MEENTNANSNAASGAPNMVHVGRCNVLTVDGSGHSVSSDDLLNYWGALVKNKTAVSIRFKSYFIDKTLQTIE